MTQKTKLELLEKRAEKKTPWKSMRSIFEAGRSTLTYIWRVFKTADLFEVDGPQAEVAWIEETEPSKAELLDVAEIVNMVTDVEIKWGELEE